MTENQQPQTPQLPQLLTPREAARVLHMSYGGLAVMRCRRRSGLKFLRLGRKIFYRPQDIALWLDSLVDPGVGKKPARLAKRKGARR